MANRLQTNDIEPIYLHLVDSDGDNILGSSDIFIKISRHSNGQFLDFADDTFKSSGWSDLDRPLSESNQTNSPGVYELAGGLDTSAFTNPNVDDTYLIVAAQSGTAASLPSPEPFKVGGWSDDIHTAATVVSGTDSELSANHGTGSWETATSISISSGTIDDIVNGVWNEPVNEYSSTGSFGGAIQFLRNVGGGRWLINESVHQMILYSEDNTTEIARFSLFDSGSTPSSTNVFERFRVS